VAVAADPAGVAPAGLPEFPLTDAGAIATFIAATAAAWQPVD
jgi:hypothetical protein